jgi:pimeloyl-[acyl-carrier protein] synthase
VSRSFTPRRVEELAPAIEKRASQLVDRIDPASSSDLLAAYAGPLPAGVIADLLGVPEADQEQFRQWSDAMVRPLAAGSLDLAGFRRAREDLRVYLRAAVEERRRQSTDDLIGALVAAEENDRLGDEELLATCMLLLVAGHETTTNLIANGVWMLSSQTGRVEQFLEAPDACVEELLRLESPIQGIARVSTEEVEIGATRLPRGSLVSAMIGAANRDPEVFEKPDTLDLSRSPNPHLAFGRGVHFCLGAALARLEARIALRILFERFPRLELVEREPVWRRGALLRGLERLRLQPAP